MGSSTLRVFQVLFRLIPIFLAVWFACPSAYPQASFARPIAGGAVIAAAGMLALALFRFPPGALSRIARARRDRALFRSMAAGSRQASLVCEPLPAKNGAISDFRLLYTNRSGNKLLGSTLKRATNLLSFISPKDRGAVLQTLVRVLRSGDKERIQLGVLAPAGEGRYDMEAVRESGCVVLTTLQSQEEQVARRQVEELHGFTRAVFESAPAGIIATDSTGVIIAMNEAAERLTNFRRHELVGRHSLLRLHEPGEISERSVELRHMLGRAPGDLEVILEHNRLHERDDWTYVRRDGSLVCVHLTLTPLHTDDGLTGYLAVAFDVTERKQLAETAFYMAHHDQLTGLPNRSLVRSTIDKAVEHATETGGTVAIFVMDIDNFKRINDSLGHAGGDTVLTTVAARLLSSIRSADFVARLGGDEFVIVFPDMRSAANAEMRARTLLEAIAGPFRVGQRELCVTASIGYCLYPACQGSADELLRHADLAMYSAKASGRSSFAPFSEDLQKAAQEKLGIEDDLRKALEQGEFSLHYQPQVTCSSGSVESVEMLLRWHNPRRGNVRPDVFIPIAEEAGLLAAIGAWSLRKACADCFAAQAELGRRLRVAVNLSAEQLQHPDLFEMVQGALQDSGLPAEDLELELTEHALMSDSSCVLETLDRLRGLGISLAIDDFGTGFSSFAYILKYQVDRLKIDRSFVSRAAEDCNAAAIVRAVIAMAHGLGLKVCAEGAETEEQVDFLMRRRCDEIQGFFFAKPVPLTELREAVLALEDPAHRRSRSTVASRRRATIPFPKTAPPMGESTRTRLHA